MPLWIEDTTGLVFLDQNVLLDHLAGVGLLIGTKALYSLWKKQNQGMIC